MIFRQASGSEQVQQLRCNNYTEWGLPLTLEQYLEREQCLEQRCFCHLQAWVLIGDDGNVVAQCETYKRPVQLYRHGKLFQEAFGYGIASVFVPQEYRGHGYGTHLMKCIMEMVNGDQNAVLSHLYSDVGPTFYSRLGWTVYDPYSLILHTQKYQSTSSLSVVPVDEVALKDVVHRQTLFYQNEAIVTTSQNLSSTAVIVVPSVETVMWFRERSRIFARYLPNGMSDFSSRPFGHLVNDRSWMVYFHNFKDDTLFILHHHISSSEDAQMLLDVACKEAVSCRLSKVEIWNPSCYFQEFKNNEAFEFITRTEDSLPSIAMSNHLNIDSNDIIWIGNEKFSWI